MSRGKTLPEYRVRPGRHNVTELTRPTAGQIIAAHQPALPPGSRAFPSAYSFPHAPLPVLPRREGDPLCYGFLKVRNEIVREGNLYKALRVLAIICGGGVVCDDGSYDGTREVLEAFTSDRPTWKMLTVLREDQDFRAELSVKQTMLGMLHRITPHPTWVLWLDGDEVIEQPKLFREWLEKAPPQEAYRMHYTQLWRSADWARTDAQFDEGDFVKLWRYHPELSFEVTSGTHFSQFPKSVDANAAPRAPFEILHRGNYGKNLVWKCVQYWGGLGGVDRHLCFEGGTYRPVTGLDTPKPVPFTPGEVARIRSFENLKKREGWFAVIVPAFNRAKDLPKALGSLLVQTYPNWVAFVLDDGSTDETPEVMRAWQDRDPRIFYARYPSNRGGVAMNERGMTIACEVAEYWTRLGSDDAWGPSKLQYDREAFLRGHHAVYGCFQVQRGTTLGETCNQAQSPQQLKTYLLGDYPPRFVVSWANVAVETKILEEVRRRFGDFVDPRIRNMEDFLFNARVAAITDWVWRGVTGGGLVVNPKEHGVVSEEFEALWNCVDTGASGNELVMNADHAITFERIAEITRRAP